MISLRSWRPGQPRPSFGLGTVVRVEGSRQGHALMLYSGPRPELSGCCCDTPRWRSSDRQVTVPGPWLQTWGPDLGGDVVSSSQGRGSFSAPGRRRVYLQVQMRPVEWPVLPDSRRFCRRYGVATLTEIARHMAEVTDVPSM